MKKQITATVATLSIILALSVAGFAGMGTKLTVNIPFEFTVSGKTLPAGTYTVKQGSTRSTLDIRSRENNAAAVTIVNDVDNKGGSQARLIFRRYGNQHFLAQVYDGTSNSAKELPKSKDERKAAQAGRDNLAMTPETVTITATAGQ